MSPTTTGMSDPPGLARSCATIAGDESIPCTSMPRAASGIAIAAGADPELERATTRGELGQEVALPRRVRRHVPLVVDVGDALAVGFGPVVVHRPIEADPHERYR